VAVVTANRPLNAFGYLYLGEEKGAPANALQLDLVASLQWVRDNFAAFGAPADPWPRLDSSGRALPPETKDTKVIDFRCQGRRMSIHEN